MEKKNVKLSGDGGGFSNSQRQYDMEDDSNSEILTNENPFGHLKLTKTKSFLELIEAALGLKENTECVDETIHNEVEAKVSKDAYSKKLEAKVSK